MSTPERTRLENFLHLKAFDDLTDATWLRQGARMFAADTIDHFERVSLLCQLCQQ